jgi:hypothetical protein
MLRKLFKIVLLVWLFGVYSCENMNELVIKNKNIICLIDYSNSINDQTIENYNKCISLILKSMGPKDRLNVYPIDAASSTNRVAIISENYASANKYTGTTFKLDLPDSINPPFKRDNENDIVSAKNIKKRINGYLEWVLPLIPKRMDSIKSIRTIYGHKSDIFSALYEVGYSGFDLIEKDKHSDITKSMLTASTDENHLIIFSDMVQESDIVDFNKKNLSKKDNEDIIQLLRDEEMLPNLEQAKITIYMNNNSGHIDAKRIRKVRSFWSYYFSLEDVNTKGKKANFISSDNLDNVIRLIFD